jgi:hypothetical protein
VAGIWTCETRRDLDNCQPFSVALLIIFEWIDGMFVWGRPARVHKVQFISFISFPILGPSLVHTYFQLSHILCSVGRDSLPLKTAYGSRKTSIWKSPSHTNYSYSFTTQAPKCGQGRTRGRGRLAAGVRCLSHLHSNMVSRCVSLYRVQPVVLIVSLL